MITENLEKLQTLSKEHIKSSIAIALGSMTILTYFYLRSRQTTDLYKCKNPSDQLSLNFEKREQIFNEDIKKLKEAGIKQYQRIGESSNYYVGLRGWRLKAQSQGRKPHRIIILLHSQRTTANQNFTYAKHLMQATVSDVLMIDYTSNPENRDQFSMKADAHDILQKGLQIADRQNMVIFIVGIDLGAQLAIYLASIQKYRYEPKIKGLVLYNGFPSIPEIKSYGIKSPPLKWLVNKFYKFIVRDKWDVEDLMSKIRTPVMFLVNHQQAQQLPLLQLYMPVQSRKSLYRAKSKKNINPWEEDHTDYFIQIDIFMNNNS